MKYEQTGPLISLLPAGWTNNFFASHQHQSNQQASFMAASQATSSPSFSKSPQTQQTQGNGTLQSQSTSGHAFDPSQAWPGSKLVHGQGGMGASWGGIGHFHPAAATKLEMGAWNASEVTESNSASSSTASMAQGSPYLGMNEMLGHSFAPASAGGLPAATAASSLGQASYDSAATSASAMASAASAPALPHTGGGSLGTHASQSPHQEYKERV